MNTGELPGTVTSEQPLTQLWEPETPFLSEPPNSEQPPLSPAAAFGPLSEVESPFVSEYALAGEVVASPQAEQFARLVAEMYDPEFERSVTDLVNEAAALAEDRLTHETGDPVRERANAERAIREYLAPIEREAYAMYDRLIEAAGERDLATMTEAEVNALFERFQPSVSLPSPVSEDFLGTLWKKARSAVSAVSKIAGKVMPLNIILGKLKALVRPLLERVLKFAIDKLPVALRPIAQKLAKSLLGVSAEAGIATEEAADTVREALAAADPATIQEEMDTRFTGSILRGEDFEREAEAVQFAEVQTAGTGDPLRELESARSKFAQDIISLRQGQDPTPAVEHFLPALLYAARVAIGIIGRPRVVNFLAGLIAKLIGKYVGQDAAITLSRALVDTGMRLISLETRPETEQLAAGYTIASTVEDTVNRLAADMPVEAWENEMLLEAYTLEAFEKSASANFPDSSIRPDLHEASESNGAWVLMPLEGGSKRFKKYTRIIQVNLTPQMAQWTRSFGGVRLASVLRNRYGITSNSAVAARIHLYEAIQGTTLSQISLHETGLAGLNSAGRSAWTLLHPLTPCNAAILLQEPGLGVDVARRNLSDRNMILVGQRFFFVEVPGTSPRPLPPIQIGTRTSPGGMHSQTHLVLDFSNSQIRLLIYFSEADGQQFSMALEGNKPKQIKALLNPLLDDSLRIILAGDAPKQLHVVHEAVPSQQLVPVAAGVLVRVLPVVADAIIGWLVNKVLDTLFDLLKREFQQFKDRVKQALGDPRDGITLVFVFQTPSFIETLRKMLTPGFAFPPMAAISSLFHIGAAVARTDLTVKPGFYYQ